ncbi:MAG: hypothetical protein LUC47_01340 [Clostridiales bacterium]|nr:hypothetical protein [Clostridiales bacterium]
MKWLIPDCYWPAVTTDGEYVSHEAICVLNPGKADAEVKLTLYFEDREPLTGINKVCPAQRTIHIRMDLLEGCPIPRGVPYAALVECDQEIAVQYTRVDTTQPALSISTTII